MSVPPNLEYLFPKEIATKTGAATTDRGGGKAGRDDRTGKDKGGLVGKLLKLRDSSKPSSSGK